MEGQTDHSVYQWSSPACARFSCFSKLYFSFSIPFITAAPFPACVLIHLSVVLFRYGHFLSSATFIITGKNFE